MKLAITLFSILLLATPLMAQEQSNNIFGAGVSWNQYDDPQLRGMVFYAKKLSDFNTYNFNTVDLIVTKSEEGQYKVATSISPGVAQKVMQFRGVSIYAATNIGAAVAENEVGLSWSGGGFASIPLGKKIYILPNAKILKTSLAEVQAIFGVAIGIGD